MLLFPLSVEGNGCYIYRNSLKVLTSDGAAVLLDVL